MDRAPSGGMKSHAWREASTMSMYTAIVLLAVLISLGQGDKSEDLAVIWGASIGLMVAHLFAFNVTAVVASGGKLTDDDQSSALAILGAVVMTAGVASVPYLFWKDTAVASTLSAILLAMAMGLCLYIDARSMGVTTRRSLLFAATTLTVALMVVGMKIYLSY